MSSAGLVYKFFGKEIVQNLISHLNQSGFFLHPVQVAPQDFDLIYNRLYDNFIMMVDAIDNGVNNYPPDIRPLYDNKTGIGDRVHRLNPGWNDANQNEQDRFMQACEIMNDELIWQVRSIVL